MDAPPSDIDADLPNSISFIAKSTSKPTENLMSSQALEATHLLRRYLHAKPSPIFSMG
jgi:hypothetical protein